MWASRNVLCALIGSSLGFGSVALAAACGLNWVGCVGVAAMAMALIAMFLVIAGELFLHRIALWEIGKLLNQKGPWG